MASYFLITKPQIYHELISINQSCQYDLVGEFVTKKTWLVQIPLSIFLIRNNVSDSWNFNWHDQFKYTAIFLYSRLGSFLIYCIIYQKKMKRCIKFNKSHRNVVCLMCFRSDLHVFLLRTYIQIYDRTDSRTQLMSSSLYLLIYLLVISQIYSFIIF